MGYFKLKKNVFAVNCLDQVIIFDPQSDSYVFLDHITTLCLQACLKHNHPPNEGVAALLQASLLEINEYSKHSYRDADREEVKIPLSSNIISELNTYPKKIKHETPLKWKWVLSAWFILGGVSLLIKLRKLNFLLRYISYLNKKKYRFGYDLEKIYQIVNSVNRAAHGSLLRCKCLEWALTCVILSLKNNLLTYLSIGVKRDPFMAHAWVESREGPVAETIDCRKYFYTIFSTKNDS